MELYYTEILDTMDYGLYQSFSPCENYGEQETSEETEKKTDPSFKQIIGT